MKYTKRKITMDDIAARLGISKNSVLLALNNKLGVSNDFHREIVATAREMSYKGISRAIPKSRYIALVSADYLRNDAFFYRSRRMWYNAYMEYKSNNNVVYSCKYHVELGA